MLELLVADVGPWFCNFSSLRGGIRPLELSAQDNNPPSDQSLNLQTSRALSTQDLTPGISSPTCHSGTVGIYSEPNGWEDTG
jgi:hypothetical protein